MVVAAAIGERFALKLQHVGDVQHGWRRGCDQPAHLVHHHGGGDDVGVGWNHVEYEALNTEWKTRGAHQAEQIAVMRKLWTEDLVTYKGKFHDLQAVNIMPPPVQRPIPVWFGGSSDAVIKRAARIGDGWMPIMAPDAAGEAKLAALHGHLAEFGRDKASFGLEAWIRANEPDEEMWGRSVEGWRRLGAEMVMLYPLYRMSRFDQLISVLARFKAVAGG